MAATSSLTREEERLKFPPGYRFAPQDEELIDSYLFKKVMKETLPLNKIQEVNLYKYNPDDLAVIFKEYGEKDWYFFTPRDRKYRNGKRPNRAAGTGFWKATGADKIIHSKKKGCIVGYRKTLVFYNGKSPKGEKTNWIMQEYRIHNPPPTHRTSLDDMKLDDWVLCKIYKKISKKDEKNEELYPQLELAVEEPHDTYAIDNYLASSEIEEANNAIVVYDESAAFEFHHDHHNATGDSVNPVAVNKSAPTASEIDYDHHNAAALTTQNLVAVNQYAPSTCEMKSMTHQNTNCDSMGVMVNNDVGLNEFATDDANYYPLSLDGFDNNILGDYCPSMDDLMNIHSFGLEDLDDKFWDMGKIPKLQDDHPTPKPPCLP